MRWPPGRWARCRTGSGGAGCLLAGFAVLVAADLVLALGAGLVGVAVGVALWGLHMALTPGAAGRRGGGRRPGTAARHRLWRLQPCHRGRAAGRQRLGRGALGGVRGRSEPLARGPAFAALGLGALAVGGRKEPARTTLGVARAPVIDRSLLLAMPTALDFVAHKAMLGSTLGAMTPIPTDHPLRYRAGERVARPALPVGGRAEPRGLSGDQGTARRRQPRPRRRPCASAALLDRHGGAAAAARASRITRRQIGRHDLKWESHTEFVTYSRLRAGASRRAPLTLPRPRFSRPPGWPPRRASGWRRFRSGSSRCPRTSPKSSRCSIAGSCPTALPAPGCWMARRWWRAIFASIRPGRCGLRCSCGAAPGRAPGRAASCSGSARSRPIAPCRCWGWGARASLTGRLNALDPQLSALVERMSGEARCPGGDAARAAARVIRTRKPRGQPLLPLWRNRCL